MRIIIGELKKIWNIKIIGIIIVLCAIYFSLYLIDDIRWYRSGGPWGNIYFAHHLTENYGTSLSLEDFEDFLNYRYVIVAQLEPFFLENAFFAEMGIRGYDDLFEFRQYYGLRYEHLSDEEQRLFHAASLELGYIVRTERYGDLVSENETPEAYNRMRAFSNIVGLYETNIIGEADWPPFINSFMEHHPLTESEYRRLAQIRDSGELTNIMTQHTLWHTRRYARNLAALVVFVTLVLVSSLVTFDRASKVNWLQYSCKQGRRIFSKQLLAVLVSAVGVTTILVAVFAGIFAVTTGVHGFWHNGINSFLGGGSFHWLSITYWQYWLLMVGVMYMLSIGAAALAFVLSRFSNNMIRLIFKLIPLLVAAVTLSNRALDDFLAIYYGGNAIVQAGMLVLALAAGIVISAITVCREKHVELM